MKFDYDVIVIGGGAAGLTVSGMAVNFGAKTLLVEKNKLGGDCTWYGCIPSKSLLHAAKKIHHLKYARKLGIDFSLKDLDIQQIFKKVRDTRVRIFEEADHPSIYEKMGIEVIHGRASFVDSHSLSIETDSKQKKLTSKYIIIAAGSSPIVPPITGLETTDYLTNESIFELESSPEKMTIIGGGPIGSEMAQAFQRLGSHVTIVDLMDRILTKDDPEYSEILKNRLEEEGISFCLDVRIDQVRKSGDQILVDIIQEDKKLTLDSDALLIAAGRKANVSDLQLSNAGINFDNTGVHVDKHCRTNIKNIYACGDITGSYQLTHMSEHMAKVAVTNALLKIPAKVDSAHITWCTYTDPEVAHVGSSERELGELNIDFEIYRFPYTKLDRAIAEDETTGMIKVFAKKRSGKILGVTIIGNRAGDMIGEYALAMKNGITLRKIADTIHPYPTYGLGNRRAADQWYVRQQSIGFVKWLKRIFGYRGPLPDLSDPDRIV